MSRTPRVLATGIYFGEGPRWRDGRLWFSDFHAHAVLSVSLAGDLRTEFGIDDQPSGLGWMPDGSLLVVSMTKRQVLRRTPDGRITVHADLSAVAGFHCNDMVVDATGRAYVGNFGFDIDAAFAAGGTQSVLADHPTANLACVSPSGEVSIAATGLHFPNGTVITPDGRTLVIAESLGAVLTAFDIAPDGSLYNRRCWARTAPYAPDGIALDANGNIWIANALGPQCVLIAPGGQVLDVIDTGQPCYACMLGGEDGRSLFMLTAGSSVAHVAARERTGRALVASVNVGRAGLP